VRSAAEASSLFQTPGVSMPSRDSIFELVKQAVAKTPEVSLREFGAELGKSIKGDWFQCVCPVCDDKSGSASKTRRGFQNCHQCSSKIDLFQWLGKVRSASI
jgi:hypothetical protein